ncbi:hypothetical protein O4H53_04125 [Sulfitobacter sp. G21635-S1]|nr:hypothetical protein [Sulfitobacter sp. G21635-S1]
MVFQTVAHGAAQLGDAADQGIIVAVRQTDCEEICATGAASVKAGGHAAG